MKIDELIEKLARIKLEHGNLDVAIPISEVHFKDIREVRPQRPYKDHNWASAYKDLAWHSEDESQPCMLVKLLS